MGDIVLVLGPVAFQDFEVPSGINFGGRQILAVHRLPGGTRIIDAVGGDDALICFDGIFTGSNATLRARTLDTLRVAGLSLQLTWDIFFYTVLIAEFCADYRNGSWIPYRVACTVLRDEASIMLPTIPSLATAVLADIGSATDLAGGAGVALSALATAAATPNAATRGTESYGIALNGLISAQTVLNLSIGSANATMCATNLVMPGSAQDGINSLLLATTAVGQLCGLTLANSYLARATANLNNAST